jgi:hypothetical protein
MKSLANERNERLQDSLGFIDERNSLRADVETQISFGAQQARLSRQIAFRYQKT